jgi:hypothetical protein
MPVWVHNSVRERYSLEARRFPVEDAVSAIVPMADAARLLAEWSANPARFTKILVQVS